MVLKPYVWACIYTYILLTNVSRNFELHICLRNRAIILSLLNLSFMVKISKKLEPRIIHHKFCKKLSNEKLRAVY